MLLLLLLCMKLMDVSSSLSSRVRVGTSLRGGGSGRGMKRAREKETEDYSVGDSTKGLEPEDGRAPKPKVPRRSWWSLWGERSVMTNILGDVVHSAFESARRLLSWSQSPVSPGQKQPPFDKDGRLVFEGDHDRPVAIKRQIAFYFSDSNLPTGNCDLSVGLCNERPCCGWTFQCLS